MYDSNVDELLNPALYIVSARDQCYPRYIIEYKVMKSTLYLPNTNANSSRSTVTPVSSLFTATTISARTSASATSGKQTCCDIYSSSQHTNYYSQHLDILSQSSNTTISLPSTRISQSGSFRTKHSLNSNQLPGLNRHHHVIQGPQKKDFQHQNFTTKVPHPPDPRQRQHFMEAPQKADLQHHYVPVQVPQVAELQHQHRFIQVPQVVDHQHQHHEMEVSQISGFQHQHCSIEGRQIASIQHQNHGMQTPQMSNLKFQRYVIQAPQIVNPQHQHFPLQVPQIADRQHQHLHMQDPKVVILQQFKKI